jgi:hypothetical protein
MTSPCRSLRRCRCPRTASPLALRATAEAFHATCHYHSQRSDQVAVKYKKKIELMVRKPDKDPEELEEPLADCPFCNMPGPETELQCISCQNILPFDAATGARCVAPPSAPCPALARLAQQPCDLHTRPLAHRRPPARPLARCPGW